MQVREIMTKKVSTVSPKDSVQKAAKIMQDIDCGSTPVVDGSLVKGIITDRDIALKVVAHGKGPDTPIRDVMMNKVVTCTPDTDARDAANIMAKHQVRRLPIVEQDKLVGILAIGDLARVHIFVSESGHALSEISEPSTRSNSVQ